MSTDKDPYENWADEYDSQSLKCQWHAPSILFGMMYLQLSPGDSLLDLGIGTGLGALPFHKAGLEIHGIDSSPAMIERCRNRGLPWEIFQHDLTRVPWPAKSFSINHVISTGVFHFIGDLHAVISETSRVMKAGGLFGFDFHEFDHEGSNDYSLLKDGIYETYDAEYDQHFYRHTEDYVLGLLSETGFRVIHDVEFLASRKPKRYFRTLISQF